MDEKYHPTRVLARNLTANCEPKPSMRHQPHHIIPGGGRHENMEDIRLMLFDCGIGINDPFNGVWLGDETVQYLTPDATRHSDTFGWNYEQWVWAQLQNRSTEPPNPNNYQTSLNNESPFVKRLRYLKRKLKSGTVPEKVGMEKDPSWSGT